MQHRFVHLPTHMLNAGYCRCMTLKCRAFLVKTFKKQIVWSWLLYVQHERAAGNDKQRWRKGQIVGFDCWKLLVRFTF